MSVAEQERWEFINTFIAYIRNGTDDEPLNRLVEDRDAAIRAEALLEARAVCLEHYSIEGIAQNCAAEIELIPGFPEAKEE